MSTTSSTLGGDKREDMLTFPCLTYAKSCLLPCGLSIKKARRTGDRLEALIPGRPWYKHVFSTYLTRRHCGTLIKFISASQPRETTRTWRNGRHENVIVGLLCNNMRMCVWAMIKLWKHEVWEEGMWTRRIRWKMTRRFISIVTSC